MDRERPLKAPERLIESRLGERIQRVVKTAPWYARTATTTDKADFTHPPKRAMPIGPEQELLNIFSGAKHRLEIEPPKAKFVTGHDGQMERGHKPLHMRTKLERRRVFKNRWVYPMECTCGSRVFLTAKEILRRDALGLGCGRRLCDAPAVDKRIWYDARTALKLQLVQLHTWYRERIGQEITDDFPNDIVSQMYANEDLVTQIKGGNWWFSLLDEDESVVHDMIILKDTPDELLFPNWNVHILVGDWPTTVNELCELYQLEASEVLSKRIEIADDERLLDELLRRKI